MCATEEVSSSYARGLCVAGSRVLLPDFPAGSSWLSNDFCNVFVRRAVFHRDAYTYVRTSGRGFRRLAAGWLWRVRPAPGVHFLSAPLAGFSQSWARDRRWDRRGGSAPKRRWSKTAGGPTSAAEPGSSETMSSTENSHSLANLLFPDRPCSGNATNSGEAACLKRFFLLPPQNM